jgi:hypothetical protein
MTANRVAPERVANFNIDVLLNLMNLMAATISRRIEMSIRSRHHFSAERA